MSWDVLPFSAFFPGSSRFHTCHCDQFVYGELCRFRKEIDAISRRHPRRSQRYLWLYIERDDKIVPFSLDGEIDFSHLFFFSKNHVFYHWLVLLEDDCIHCEELFGHGQGRM